MKMSSKTNENMRDTRKNIPSCNIFLKFSIAYLKTYDLVTKNEKKFEMNQAIVLAIHKGMWKSLCAKSKIPMFKREARNPKRQ